MAGRLEPKRHRIGPMVIAPVGLEGVLTLPPGAEAATLFAHGNASSRFSPRNRRVADALHRWGLGVLLFDLLLPEELED